MVLAMGVFGKSDDAEAVHPPCRKSMSCALVIVNKSPYLVTFGGEVRIALGLSFL